MGLLAGAATAALGAEITIAGPRTQAPAAVVAPRVVNASVVNASVVNASVVNASVVNASVVKPGVVDAEDSPQSTIPYWQYTQRQSQAQSTGTGGLQSWANRPSVRGSFYRPRMADRNTFRYRINEFRTRRFDDLRGQSHRGRFGGRGARYTPAARYTTSFGMTRARRPSGIRYGF
jgi:hypothetical protein